MNPNTEENTFQNITFKTLEEGITDHRALVAFADPCTLESHPGWPLRNLLLLLIKYCPDRVYNGIKILCFRQQIVKGQGNSPNIITASNSLILQVGHVSDEKLNSSHSDAVCDDMKDIFKGNFVRFFMVINYCYIGITKRLR